jgi:hypothetical protein
MTTTRQLFTGALRLINAVQANEEVSAADMNVTMSAFNALIDSMANDQLNIYTFTPLRFVLQPGKASYLLGPALDVQGNPTGADWVTERPMRIENAKVILYPTISGEGTTLDPYVVTATQSTLFVPLELVSDEKYADITIRALQSTWPLQMYDNGAYPVRTIKVWPVPQQQYAVELWMWNPLATYATLDDELSLPPGYERYLRFKLAVEIAAEFGKTISDTLKIALIEAESSVKRLNQQHPLTNPSSLGSALTQRKAQGNLTRSW